jgi:hypothetical protein
MASVIKIEKGKVTITSGERGYSRKSWEGTIEEALCYWVGKKFNKADSRPIKRMDIVTGHGSLMRGARIVTIE